MASNPDLGRGLREQCPSPNRRLSKIPSASNLASAANSSKSPSSLSHKNSTKKDQEPLSKVTAKNNIKGRTLVKLQQACAGSRPLSAILSSSENISPKQAFKDRIADRRSSSSKPAAV
ncbi:hypothetical protein GQ607_017645 [Colletotrichum asianum]|uniref:Uncharacterized protein n=1 Tax=Colletotrichum asianum TaxID=702518 RepID=A0A8H3VYP8_9PEZI|nr:hypothetical protein GQ607_017645 [Colletotrichum asianum]